MTLSVDSGDGADGSGDSTDGSGDGFGAGFGDGGSGDGANVAGDASPMIVRHLGVQDYRPLWQAMQRFVDEAGGATEARAASVTEEVWLLSHPPVFTQGQAGRAEHVLEPGDIPVVQVDRGGQVTYHGPGQLVVYLLLNLKQRRLGVRALVNLIEAAVISSLQDYGISAATRPGAPGVYVGDAKIAALGLRVRRGWSYHGLSLNVDMDLTPFARINPCGYQDLAVTQIADLLPKTARASAKDDLLQQVGDTLLHKLLHQLPPLLNEHEEPSARTKEPSAHTKKPSASTKNQLNYDREPVHSKSRAA